MNNLNLNKNKKKSYSHIFFKSELLILVVALIVIVCCSALGSLFDMLEAKNAVPIEPKGFLYYALDEVKDFTGMWIFLAPFLRITSTVPYLLMMNVSRKKIHNFVLIFSSIQTFILILIKVYSEKLLLHMNPNYIAADEGLIISMLYGFTIMSLVLFSSILMLKMKISLYSGASTMKTLFGLLFVGSFIFMYTILKIFLTGSLIYALLILIAILMVSSSFMLLKAETPL